ncbi:MAG: pyridoxal-5-phosphate-dependent protein beta subunit [Novosphingobium sp.]|nr:pyridoxal-5-phosphate-dependent protein beta subunit [Novosphingobium sp.]
MQQDRARIAWMDCAKGTAILLIVLHHATTYETAIFGDSRTHLVFNWRNVGLLLQHIRLPLFFFLSGVAASGRLSRRVTRLDWSKPRGFAALYLLWAIALLCFVPDWPNFDLSYPVTLQRLAGLLIGRSVVWYLWAILLCLLVAHATRKMPAWSVVGIALGGFALLDAQHLLPGNLPALGRALPLYLVGFRYPALAIDPAPLPKGIIAALVVLIGAVKLTHVSVVWTEALLDAAGLGVGIGLARKLPEWLPRSVSPLAWTGRRTLPIYILHFPIIAAAGEASVQALGPLPMTHPLVAIFAPTLAAATVAASLALYQVLAKVGVGWLFSLGGSKPSIPAREGI